MNQPSVYLAEQALALPPPQRAGLARLLIDSLEGDLRTDAEIKATLQRRFEALRTGQDAGLAFGAVFEDPA